MPEHSRTEGIGQPERNAKPKKSKAQGSYKDRTGKGHALPAGGCSSSREKLNELQSRNNNESRLFMLWKTCRNNRVRG